MGNGGVCTRSLLSWTLQMSLAHHRKIVVEDEFRCQVGCVL